MNQTLDLSGNWQLRSDAEHNISCDMPIPGDIHSALLAAQHIPDPYVGMNEAKVQWVGQTQWTVSHHFNLDANQLNVEAIELWLEQLDTMASISINQQQVYRASNQFKRHIVDIKSAVKQGKNEISITFEPIAPIAAERAAKLPFPVPWAVGNNQVPHMNTIRKAQCHAGWDWGLCLLVAGLYQAPQIKLIQDVSLRYLEHKQEFKGNNCEVSVTLELFSYLNKKQNVKAQLGELVTERTVNIAPGVNHVQFSFLVEQPQLWWPAGYGEQPLYPLSVKVQQQSIEQHIGLRHLTLITEEDEVGASMMFRVNGRDIVCKGANWIPADAMPSRATNEKVEQLLSDAVAANMNMIRVWGGGVYESDGFYQMCDEKGILIWQDLMFACAQYPSTPEFISDVEGELAHQLKRLQHHACIALWCGDNEVIGSIGWYPESRENKRKYTVNYDRLNRALDFNVSQLDPSRRFWPSSPCNGELDFGDAWHDDNKGDMHFWDVWHSGKSFSAYREVNPRFCSEFGYQSFPSFNSVKAYADEQDWNITSPVMEWHQRNNGGNSKIVEMFTRLFRFPVGFENFLYLSQVQQAIAIKTATEYWRSTKPICMGILYWQLNDVWPVASWSSIEYNGQWKQLHYHAKRFFAPSLVTFVPAEDGIDVKLISDHDTDITFAGQLTQYAFNGDIVSTTPITAISPADQSITIHRLKISHDSPTFWHIELTSEDGQTYVENDYNPQAWKSCELAAAKLDYEMIQAEDGFSITLSSDAPAFYVTLSCDDLGRFSDNSFTLLPNQPRVIRYQPSQPISIDELNKKIKLQHLKSSY
ncbi:beta-mannosidase [Motilimonas eburnea]|uniref:beta-mannosidase n=1 Tax=Motilimonas eburnea TaxID=1737488 RepID=UPI001E3A5F2A|nr:glycoside hydrolase family 2 protein [Motilimonas eburnea]MCE2570979.1 glycoside hydrolase family 2 protein [Motilimonas eburnea]